MTVSKSKSWPALWESLRRTYEAAGLPRKVAVLDNHRDSKEAICRRLGVVSEADVARVAESLRRRGSKT